MSKHLTDAQFTDLLIGGDPTPESAQHLAQCDLCRSELSKFSGSVSLFNVTSLEQSAAQPSLSLRTQAARPSSHSTYVPLRWALAAALLVTIAIPTWKYDHRSPAEITPPDDSAAQIAQDDQLLQSVNVALNSDEASPLPEYHLSQKDLRTTR